MNYEFVSWLGAGLVGAVGLWKIYVEISRDRLGQLREEYKFAKEFLADIEKNPQMSPFLKVTLDLLAKKLSI
ncbi:MAG: hypothetical protein HEQ39_15460 [Rhizobacter sp.]